MPPLMPISDGEWMASIATLSPGPAGGNSAAGVQSAAEPSTASAAGTTRVPEASRHRSEAMPGCASASPGRARAPTAIASDTKRATWRQRRRWRGIARRLASGAGDVKRASLLKS